MIHARKDYNRIQDPLGKIAKDEPVFLVRAQDKIAADLVREYGKRNTEAGGDPVVSALCFTHALAMDQWRERHGGGKMADLPEDYFTHLHERQEG